MSRLYYHEKKDRAKWAIVTLTLLLIIAVIVTGVLSDWFTNFNKYCVFGHDYADDGKCSRCGKVKPIENEPEQEQPQLNAVAYASKNLLADSAPINKNTPSSIIEYQSGLPDGNAKYPFVYDSNLNNILRINGNEPKKETILVASDTKMVLGVSENPEDGFYYYTVYKRRDKTKWTNMNVSVDSPRTVNNTSSYFGVYDVFLMKGDILSEKNYTLYTYSDWFTVYYGIGEELPPEPVKQGYTFTGWYTDEACTQLYTEDIVVGDITLYAGFRANTYTLNFISGGDYGNMQEMQCTYGVEYTLPTCTLECPSYRFVGWCIDNDDTATQTVDLTDGQKFSNLSDSDNAVIDLFAMWELNEATVSFEWDDANVLEVGCIIGQAVKLPDEPSKTGYIFIGWQYDDGTMYEGQAITEDTTLTAKFEIIQCVVTFVVDGEVYCVYVCDYGTKLSEALRKSDVNTALYKTEDEYSRNF